MYLIFLKQTTCYFISNYLCFSNEKRLYCQQGRSQLYPHLGIKCEGPLGSQKKRKKKEKKITNVPNQMFTLKSNGYLPIILLSLMKLQSVSMWLYKQEVPQCQEHFHNENNVVAIVGRLMGELGAPQTHPLFPWILSPRQSRSFYTSPAKLETSPQDTLDLLWYFLHHEANYTDHIS